MANKRATDRAFGLVLGGVFCVIALIAWRLSGRVPGWAIGIGGFLWVAALATPGLLMPLNRIWSWLGMRIAGVVNHLLLGAFFYAIVVPIGMVMRLLRRSSMLRRPDPGADSYWTPVGRQATADTYPDLF